MYVLVYAVIVYTINRVIVLDRENILVVSDVNMYDKRP